MGIFFSKKNKDDETAGKKPVPSDGFSAGEKKETVPSDTRIGYIMNRLYRLVLSVDLNTGSCYIESGDPRFSDVSLPPRGLYIRYLAELKKLVPEEEQNRLNAMLGVKELEEAFRRGRTWACVLMKVDGQLSEIRVERIPEQETGSLRKRCCIFFRPVNAREDNGRIWSVLGGVSSCDVEYTENERVLATVFVGAYEISIARNQLTGYEKKNGTFTRTSDHIPLVATVKAWIDSGIIHPDSAEFYRDLARPGVLAQKIRNGSYTAQVQLKSPGAKDYRWYEETVFPMGENFLVYRKDINTEKKLREEERRAREQNRMDRYTREVLENVAGLVEFRNIESGDHIRRVREVTKILLEDVAERSPRYGLTKKQVRMYTEASVLHDVGKIVLPDSILNKPDKLTREEQLLMREHTVKGALIIDRMIAEGNEELNACCRDVVLHHHERFDGSGYPDGLIGDQISIGAQVVSLADAFDALSSKRIYKPAYSCEQAMEMISAGDCGAFQPRLLDSMRHCFKEISEIYAEEKPEPVESISERALAEM